MRKIKKATEIDCNPCKSGTPAFENVDNRETGEFEENRISSHKLQKRRKRYVA